jgi:hypothetical protein
MKDKSKMKNTVKKNSKTATTTKNGKKTAKRATRKAAKRLQLFGFGIGAIARRLGRLGWKASTAVKAIQAKVPQANAQSIRARVYRGAVKSAPKEREAQLTTVQIATLKKLAA